MRTFYTVFLRGVYGIFSIHMQKFSTGDIKGLEVEVDRKSKNFKNQDINYSLSQKNIDLIKPKINLYFDTLNRVDELKNQVQESKRILLLMLDLFFSS